ncbi:MAG: hypothetical protein KF855_14270 [Acidobacteria bacterium]|nr:hypothetical protein [Acidobacteriota bacterium]
MTSDTTKPTTAPSKARLRDIAIILLFSAVLVSPIALFGIPDNFDVMEHMRFAVTYSDSLSRGDVLAVWSDKDNFGFGGAGVRLYPPLTYILFSFIHLFISGWHLPLSILLFIGMAIGCLGVYKFTDEFYPNGYPLLAALVYALVPYHLFQIFQLFLLAEFMAAAFTPFVFYYGTKIVRDGGIKNSLLFSLFFSLVVLSHIPSTIILSIALALFLAIQIRKETFFRTALYTIVSAILTLTATAFYWLKVITEVKWVKHDAVDYHNSGLYTYSSYLFPIFLDPPDFYQMKVLWMFDVNIALMLVTFLFLASYLLVKRKADALLASILATACLSLFLTTFLSSPIWNNIEFLQKLQFPWRWLSIAMIMTAILSAAFVETLKEQKAAIGRPLIYSLVTLVFVTATFVTSQIIIPMAPLSPAEFDRQVDELGATIGCKCWWPVWAEGEALGTKEKVLISDRNVEVEIWESPDRRFNIAAGQAGNARIATFYYPYWRGEVNGSAVEVSAADDGTILIPVPSEQAEVRLFFDEPMFLITSKYISLATWLLLIIALLATSRRSSKLYQPA